jgi:uncharacterized protein YijF (DUF1287 family)
VARFGRRLSYSLDLQRQAQDIKPMLAAQTRGVCNKWVIEAGEKSSDKKRFCGEKMCQQFMMYPPIWAGQLVRDDRE